MGELKPCPHCGGTGSIVPDEVHFWYMHDNHCFTRLTGSLLEVAAQTVTLAEESTYGMLCPPILLRGGKEVRRVSGGHVHHHGRERHAEFIKDVADWVVAMHRDPDVDRLSRALPPGGAET